MAVIEGSLGVRSLRRTNHVHRAVRRNEGAFIDMGRLLGGKPYLGPETKAVLDRAFILYRALAAMMFNFAQSGHPGGSISAGRLFLGLFLTGQMDYDISQPWRRDADICSLAAGHKAMGWYAFNALLNEAVGQTNLGLLPTDLNQQLRLEDLLAFRKNEADPTAHLLRDRFRSRCLDGHPTPATPFTYLATGASGVGVASSAGLAIAARDVYRTNPPRVYCIEGEGGMTPGRVEEVLQITSRAQLGNFILVVDHNDASIDVPGVCAGDYTQVKPEERGLLHRFNVIVAEGKDFDQVAAAFDYARIHFKNDKRPTMIVFRTEKGEGYGFGTHKSHGAGHKMDALSYFEAQRVFEENFGVTLPRLPESPTPQRVEESYWLSLQTIRSALKNDIALRDFIWLQVSRAKERLEEKRQAITAPEAKTALTIEAVPDELQRVKPGDRMALREALAISLGEINRRSRGGMIVGAADLFGSLALNRGLEYLPVDADHLDGRALATGITEDGSFGVMAGISAYGYHMGAFGSYGAFSTPMSWTAARLHAIGYDADPRKYALPLIVIAGHAGPKTGEDGPTHACPQALSAWASFPKGLAVTLTPWEVREVWPLLHAALTLKPRPAVVVPFVTRPQEVVVDREALGLANPLGVSQGLYYVRPPRTEGPIDAWVVLQGSGVMHELVANNAEALRDIDQTGVNVGFAYVSSRELLDTLPAGERAKIWNRRMAQKAMGVTDFTVDTMWRWITSPAGRKATLHPFQDGHFLGSGVGSHVLRQGGLAAEDIKNAVIAFAKERKEGG